MENDIKVLKELYKFICVSEGIKAIALKFCKVGRGGDCCIVTGKQIGRAHV